MTSDSSRKTLRDVRRGFSLLEAAIVLGIVGVVLSALWGVVSIVNDKVKRSQTAEQMVAIVTNVRQFYQNRVRVSGPPPANSVTAAAVTDYLLRQGVMPAEQIRDRTAGVWVADTAWGARGASGIQLPNGGVRVSGQTALGVDTSDRAFLVELRGLSYSNCIEMATKMAGANPAGVLMVHINMVPIMPVTPDAASAVCTQGPAGEQNIVSFLYALRQQN